jgi:hypothetical protein
MKSRVKFEALPVYQVPLFSYLDPNGKEVRLSLSDAPVVPLRSSASSAVKSLPGLYIGYNELALKASMICLFFTIVAIGLAGCVGAAIKHKERVGFDSPRIDSNGGVCSSPAAEPLSKSEVERIWGPPSRIQRIDDSVERWIYRSCDLRWAGAELLVLVLPIPLILPVGHEKVTLTMKDGRATFAEVVKEDESRALVGLIPQMCGCRWGCETSAGRNGPPDTRSVNPTWIGHAKKD